MEDNSCVYTQGYRVTRGHCVYKQRSYFYITNVAPLGLTRDLTV